MDCWNFFVVFLAIAVQISTWLPGPNSSPLPPIWINHEWENGNWGGYWNTTHLNWTSDGPRPEKNMERIRWQQGDTLITNSLRSTSRTVIPFSDATDGSTIGHKNNKQQRTETAAAGREGRASPAKCNTQPAQHLVYFPHQPQSHMGNVAWRDNLVTIFIGGDAFKHYAAYYILLLWRNNAARPLFLPAMAPSLFRPKFWNAHDERKKWFLFKVNLE